MNNFISFSKIKQYDKFIINISKKDYIKIKNTINLLKNKYDKKIVSLYKLEKNNIKEFNFIQQKNFILKHKKIVLDIIKDVLFIYKEEMKNLQVVFLSGSFARGTNKMSSDIDLHFYYSDKYNYIYEEIVCYIISRIINKSRDCIDPTFIFNVQSKNKVLITKKMNDGKLNVILKYNGKQIKYSYKFGKKRRFFIQYTNTRNIKKLFNYLKQEMYDDNKEYCHCFEIIKGEKYFNNLYEKLFVKELKLIDDLYIKNKIQILKNKILNIKLNDNMKYISEYKKNYQSKIFEYIYEYISIVRFILLKNNISIKFLNLFDIYDKIKNNVFFNKNTFIVIYEYLWHLEKLSFYCYENKINYGLHNNDLIDYSTVELNKILNKLKRCLLKDLEEWGKNYE